MRKVQPTVLGFTPRYGRIEVTASAGIASRSMFSVWMVGIEDEPLQCGEICLVEVCGEAVDGGARRSARASTPSVTRR